MTDVSAAPRTAGVRQALLDQLAYLIDETDVLRKHLARIPESVLEGKPVASDLSFREMYVALHLFDEKIYAPAAARLAEAETEPVSLHVPDARRLLDQVAPERADMHVVLDRIRSARLALNALLARLDAKAWTRLVVIGESETDLFGLARHVLRHDVDLLRSAATRLHESRLTSRREDIPK